MGLFSRQTTERAPVVRAAAGAGGRARDYAAYSTSATRTTAIALPTISRSRDLLASLVGAADIKHVGWQWNGENMESIALPPETWMRRPDPAVTRNFILSWTFDDLFFFGRAFWLITARTADGFPSAFTRLPASDVQTADQAGPVWYGPSDQVTFNGFKVPSTDLVQFLSPSQGLIYSSWRAITIAHQLDNAAKRFAVNEIPAGWLRQVSGEPMSGDELSDLAAAFSAARADGAVAALNEAVEWHEASIDPNRLQLVESRQHQALELARVCNVPPFLVGAPSGGSMTYQNAQESRVALATFGARQYLDCIQETLSADSVLPRGRSVELGLERWIADPFTSPSAIAQEALA